MRFVTMGPTGLDIHLPSKDGCTLCSTLLWICLLSFFVVSAARGDDPSESKRRYGVVVAGFIGYGIPHFEEQADWGGASEFLPAGLQCFVKVSSHLSVGAELNHSILPFRWDVKPGSVKIAEWSISQTAISGLLKYHSHRHGNGPHARVGFGLYLNRGRSEFEEGWGRDYELEYTPGFGVNPGVGVTKEWGGKGVWLIEAVYHVSYCRIDEDGAEFRRHSSFAIHLGAGLKL